MSMPSVLSGGWHKGGHQRRGCQSFLIRTFLIPPFTTFLSSRDLARSRICSDRTLFQKVKFLVNSAIQSRKTPPNSPMDKEHDNRITNDTNECLPVVPWHSKGSFFNSRIDLCPLCFRLGEDGPCVHIFGGFRWLAQKKRSGRGCQSVSFSSFFIPLIATLLSYLCSY